MVHTSAKKYVSYRVIQNIYIYIKITIITILILYSNNKLKWLIQKRRVELLLKGKSRLFRNTSIEMNLSYLNGFIITPDFPVM